MRFLLLLSLYSSLSFAIIDIATVDFGDKPEGFSGAAFGSFQKQRGNTVKDEMEYGGRIQFDTNKSVTWLQGDVEKDKVGSLTTDDNAFLHLRHIKQGFTPNWGFELYAQYKRDKFKLLENRTLYGMGARYRIANSKKYGKLFLGVSAMEERIKYTQEFINPTEHNYRVSSYLSYKFSVNNNLDISYRGYYQPKFDNSSDYLTFSLAELTIHLTKVFDLSYLLDFRHDSRPPMDVSRTDMRQKLSFVYRFGKDDPFSAYAYEFINSVDKDEENNSGPIKTEHTHSASSDLSLAGEWQYKDEKLSIFTDRTGTHTSKASPYDEKLNWILVSGDKEKSVFVQVNVLDQEERVQRSENYLWNENTLVHISGNTVKVFKR